MKTTLFQGPPLFSHPFLVKTPVITSKWRVAGQSVYLKGLCLTIKNLIINSRRRDRSSSKLREERSPSDQSSPKSAFENAHKNIREMAHFRTKSDITPTATNNTKPSKTFSLSRSKSIASARDKWKISSSYGLLPFLSRDSSKSNLNESGERSSQENMNREIEGLQAKYKTESQERQRLERKMEKIVKLYDQSQV